MNINDPETPPGAFRLPVLFARSASLMVWTISITLGVAVFFQLQSFTGLFDRSPEIWLAVGVVGVVVGTITGVVVMLLQLLVPIHRVIRTKRWALGTLGAWSLAGAVYEILYWLPEPSDVSLRLLVIGIGIGLAFGLVQWLAARRYAARAQWLLISNVLGWSVGYTVAMLLFLGDRGAALGLIPNVVVLGVIAGLITGITLSALPTCTGTT